MKLLTQHQKPRQPVEVTELDEAIGYCLVVVLNGNDDGAVTQHCVHGMACAGPVSSLDAALSGSSLGVTGMSGMTVNNPTGPHGGFFGGDNHGPIVVNPAPQAPEPQPFNVRKRRLFPIGERLLNLSAALLTVGAGFGGWKEFEQIMHAFPLASDQKVTEASSTGGAALPSVSAGPVIVLGACLILLVVVVALRHRVRTRTMGFFGTSLLPVLAGVTDGRGRGRLALLRLEGRCHQEINGRTCGGKLRFYNKPVSWIDHYNADGSTKRKVTDRTAAAECRRNPNHWYKIDVTDVD